MQQYFKRALNILVLLIAYVRINVFSFLCAIKWIVLGRGSPYALVHKLASILEPRYVCVKGSKPIRGGKTMYFVNHRSWADFFVDGDMISNSSYLSRMAVIFAFPPACLCGYLLQFVWFFKRQRGISREWFTSFFKKNWAIRPNSGVIVYPEGHRFKGEGTLNLKTGVMEVAYNLGVPCQIVLSNGKEKLMDEISLQINKHQLITICVSDVLDPTQFKTKEEWFEYVREQWKKTYEQLNQGEPEGEPFFAPLPGLKKEQEEESLPLKRRTIASVFAAAIVAVTAIVVRVILRFL